MACGEQQVWISFVINQRYRLVEQTNGVLGLTGVQEGDRLLDESPRKGMGFAELAIDLGGVSEHHNGRAETTLERVQRSNLLVQPGFDGGISRPGLEIALGGEHRFLRLRQSAVHAERVSIMPPGLSPEIREASGIARGLRRGTGGNAARQTSPM